MPTLKPQIPVPHEHEEQKAVFDWAKANLPLRPELALLHAIPNGGHRRKAVAAKLKAEGVKSGVPDIDLPVARGGYHGLKIEMKRTRGGVTSPEQKWWIEQLTAQGYSASVCHGAESAIKTIEWYLNLKPQEVI
ncbi:MAG: VRR-NUC domain-containing protein [Chitinispirillia bacterium]|nr:VRR-NUC domain-containing protein [Chitinispirillia bacterium]MCL2242177.1 VRR-NUC domain-containing protein [Chitinispirillia bacterium]